MGVVLFTVAFVTARRHHHPLDGARSLRHLLSMARQGLAVLRSPWPALGAILLQCAGWLMQLFAVYVSMRAFDIHASMAAAGLVLLLMNVATIFPLWPGNIGLLQAAVALPLVQYGVPYSAGFAYALVLQVIEMSVGVGVGLVFLAREGLSFANLRDMPDESETPVDEEGETQSPREAPCARSRARLASKASSRRPQRPQRWRRDCARRAPTRSSSRSPTAARARRRRSGSPAAANGERQTSTMRSVPRVGHDGSSCRRERRSSRPPPRSARSWTARSFDRVEPRLRRARPRSARGRGEEPRARPRRDGDDGRAAPGS